jgi:hypothetical protein
VWLCMCAESVLLCGGCIWHAPVGKNLNWHERC